MKRWPTKNVRWGVSILLVLWYCLFAMPTRASITVTGEVTPSYSGTDPWDTGIRPPGIVVGGSVDGGLTLSDGSVVRTDRDFYAGRYQGISGTVAVSGDDSLLYVGECLYVGYNGQGNMVVNDQGEVYASTSNIGHSGTGYVHVTGPGSLWTLEYGLKVGHSGNGTLVIDDGAQVHNVIGYIGYNSNGVGQVLVSGSDSSFTNTNELVIGYEGEGELIVSDGASVTSKQGYIGRYANSYGSNPTTSSGTVRVEGIGSEWILSSGLIAGSAGDANLVITEGGEVHSCGASVGGFYGGKGEVTVSGQQSLWENTGSLSVGGHRVGLFTSLMKGR